MADDLYQLISLEKKRYHDNQKKGISRRTFVRRVATSLGLGVLAAAGIYSYSPWRSRMFPEIVRKQTDIGVCKSVRVTNISETSWFDNSMIIGDIKKAGGLLVNQYSAV